MTTRSSKNRSAKHSVSDAENAKPAEPPRDNPRTRAAELSEDVLFAGEMDAVGHPRAVASLGRRASSFAQLRLKALAQARDLAGVAALTPAARGVSNWVQMGPTAIPLGQTYSAVRVFVTGRLTAIAVHPTTANTIYVGTARGGVWGTTNGGHSWTPISDNEVSLAIGALALAPSNPQIIYAGTGEGNLQYYSTALPLNSSPDNYLGAGVLKSTDGGNHWTLQGATPAKFAGAGFFRITVHPTNPDIVFAATSRGLFRTIDGGSTWNKLTSGLPVITSTILAASDVVIAPSSPNTVYVAFFGDGIYKTTNANAATPTWTKQTGALPTAKLNRIALAIAPSSPSTIYALLGSFDAEAHDVLQGLYVTDASGAWVNTGLVVSGIQSYATYTMDLTVDPTTPNIIYIAGVSLHKASRNTVTGIWSQIDVGSAVHPDTHCVAVDPTNHLVVYVGNDGGIYKSINGAISWDDTINEGLCITQFEFMDQHPTSDAMCIGGTQDNGTEMFCNSPVFHHADDGDGGFVAIDYTEPRNVLSTYYGATPKRSTQAGRFGTWMNVKAGLQGNSVFYPPFALDQTNSNNIAFGTDRINLDSAQGTGGWPTKVTLPGISGRVSALSYIDSNLIYCATTTGQVFRLSNSGASWNASAIHAAPLPSRWVWDVATRPGDTDTVVVVMSGYGTAHIWRGTIPAAGTATWSDISGTGAARLPDIPINSLVIDPAVADTMYVGTDIGVFRTTDSGTTWALFNNGLPNVAVYDMGLHAPSRLLRAATHGRGMWERKLDLALLPDVYLFVRDHTAATGRVIPTPAPMPAPYDDALHYVALGDTLWWYQCADIKIDALQGAVPSYQMNVADVNYIAFETKLVHRNPQRGDVNRVYVQVRNRGIQSATNVTVKLLSANAAAGLPDLPADFWTVFPGNDFDQTYWKPIGDAKLIASLSPTEPAILEWDWTTPITAADHTCLLMLVDCVDDAIPAENKIVNIADLVRNERRVGLKNLHIVNAMAGTYYWTPFFFHGNLELHHAIRFLESKAQEWKIGFVFPKGSQADLKLEGVKTGKLTKVMLNALRAKIGNEIEKFSTQPIYMLANAEKGGAINGVRLPQGGLGVMLLLLPGSYAAERTLTILQIAQEEVVGGSTFVLQASKPASLAPTQKTTGAPVF